MNILKNEQGGDLPGDRRETGQLTGIIYLEVIFVVPLRDEYSIIVDCILPAVINTF